MKRLRSHIARVAAGVALVAAAAPTTAQAQVSFSQTFTLSPAASVQYLPFTVTTAGSFRIRTLATNGASDPMIFLFNGTPGSLSAVLASDDDACGPAQGCPLRDGGAQRNSLINASLALGDFTVAVSRYSLAESEARNGVNLDVGAVHDVPVTIDSQSGLAVFPSATTAPVMSSISMQLPYQIAG